MPPVKNRPADADADAPTTTDAPTTDAPAARGRAAKQEDTRSATEIAAAAAEEQGIRPIDLPNPVHVADDHPRASKRGEYVREDNRAQRIVVAAGDPIPVGYVLDDDSPLADRAANTATVHPDAGGDAPAGSDD